MTRLSNATLPQITVPKPRYDRAQVTDGIVHLGVGGFHRAHQAVYLDDLMNAGKALDWGCAASASCRRMRGCAMPSCRRMSCTP